MQCYQGEALRLQVYLEAHVLIPEITFDLLMIDQVLDEFEVRTHKNYMELEASGRVELAKRLSQLCLNQLAHQSRRVA